MPAAEVVGRSQQRALVERQQHVKILLLQAVPIRLIQVPLHALQPLRDVFLVFLALPGAASRVQESECEGSRGQSAGRVLVCRLRTVRWPPPAASEPTA